MLLDRDLSLSVRAFVGRDILSDQQKILLRLALLMYHFLSSTQNAHAKSATFLFVTPNYRKWTQLGGS